MSLAPLTEEMIAVGARAASNFLDDIGDGTAKSLAALVYEAMYLASPDGLAAADRLNGITARMTEAGIKELGMWAEERVAEIRPEAMAAAYLAMEKAHEPATFFAGTRFCRDCRYSARIAGTDEIDGNGPCAHPKARGPVDLVTGYDKGPPSMWMMRGGIEGHPCGREGRWFEPLEIANG